MEVRKDSQNGTPVASPTDTIGAFQVQTQDCIDNWAQQLGDDPDRFADIEQQIDQHYRQGAGQLVASLLAEVTSDPQMDEHVEKIRQNAAKGGIRFALPPTISCGRVRSARRRVDHRGPDQLPRRSGGVGRTRGHELENAFG